MSVGGQFSLLATMQSESVEKGEALEEAGLCRTPVKGKSQGGVVEEVGKKGSRSYNRRKQGKRRDRKEIGQESPSSDYTVGSKKSNGKKRNGQTRGQKNGSMVAEQQQGLGNIAGDAHASSHGAVPDTPRLARDIQAAHSEGSSADASIELIENALVGVEQSKDGKQKKNSKNRNKEAAAAKATPGDKVSGESDNVIPLELDDTVSESRKFCAASNGLFSIGMELETKSKMSGPVAIDALAKEGSKKKEDKWILKPQNAWEMPDVWTGKTNVSAWGVFDGHGGRQVATFASHTLLKSIAEYCADPFPVHEKAPLSGDMPLGLPHASDDDVMEWKLQNELIRRLPNAIQKSFLECDAAACKRFANGGTTATVALLCGWQLIVANVGDSCAYLDTGAEVLAVSGNHRLEDNKSEVSRIEASGGEVAPSSIDGKPAGPIRVWPGGLAMSRTIGDRDSGNLTAAVAEVFQITIPSDGARLFIASDGLWDAVHPKTAAHHTRDMTAADAAHKLLSMAIKKDNLKDDVTVVVVDFCPSEDNRMPPGLSMHKLSGKKGKGHVDKLADVWQPLLSETHNWSLDEYMRRVDVSKSISMKLEEERLLKMEQEERAAEQSRKDHAEREKESGLYHELMNLKLSPNDFEQGDEWVTVEKAHGGDRMDDTMNKKVKNPRAAKKNRFGQGRFRNKPKSAPYNESTQEHDSKSSKSGKIGHAHQVDATEAQGNKPSRAKRQFRKKRPLNAEKNNNGNE